MRPALRSTGRHAHRKGVHSARRHTRRSSAVAPLGVRPRLLRLGGLKRSHENPTDSKFRVIG